MLGFATIDAQAHETEVAVWLTSLVESQRANHVNAVVIGRDDVRLTDKVRALTGDRAVVVTDDTTLDGLGIEMTPLTSASLSALVAETIQHQERISEAVAAYGRSRGTKPVAPEFYGDDRLAGVPLKEDSPAGRALQTATVLARAWTSWLQTDEQRRRRTVRPQDGGTPWMMPEDLSSPNLATLPAEFADLAQRARVRLIHGA